MLERALLAVAWQSALLTPEYTDFLPIMDVVGHAPGYQLDERPGHTLPEPGAWPRALVVAIGLALAWALRRVSSTTE